jgi:hypothetical protein
MSNNNNLFQEVLNNAEGVQNKLLGPTYPYYKNIKTPTQLGITSNGTLSALGNDINGLINYVSVLVEGNSKASVTGRPLGNKFFLKTGAQCLDKSTNKQVDRYIYVDNVPNGNIPFVSSGLGVNFSNFRGLIPGAMQDLNVLNPYAIMQSFLSGSMPPCQQLTMQTIDINNNSSSETHYVTLVDIQNMNSCSFQDGINPITKKKCQQAFQTLTQNEILYNNNNQIMLPQDPVAQLYFLGLSALAIYILYGLIQKNNGK